MRTERLALIAGKMKTCWHKLTLIGVHENLDMREARRISYINYITLLSMLYLVMRSVLNISNLPYCSRMLALIIPAILIFILNYYRLYTLAKISLFTVFVTATSVYSYMYLGGLKYGSFMLLFAAVPWPYMLFDLKQRAFTYTSLGYLIFCFMMMIILQHVRPLPVSEGIDIEVVRISVTILTIFFLLLLTWYFCSSNAAAEKVLLQEKEKAESANRAKSRFLANMSHELRTPLNAILGFSELMQRDSSITKEQRGNLETIGRSGEHLLSLINDVLEFSKIEAGQIDLNRENINLYQLLLGLEEMFRLCAREKDITLEFFRGADVPQYICTDQSKLRQILINLLGNAVKFSETGEISLSVKSLEPGKKKKLNEIFLHFEVVDTGSGIPKEEQNKIFDAFFQSNNQKLSQQGTGLGLPISRKFAELMGGVLKVNSEVGKGTHFTFDIPVELADGAETESSLARHRVIGLEDGQQAFRLLVVEDNQNNRNLLVKLLQSVGFEVQEAVNGQEAIENCEKWQPHLIWMDLCMPVMDGYKAISAIKSEIVKIESGAGTIIIALTASAFEEDRLKVMECGGDDFVRKPFRETEIFEMLEKYLGVRFVYDQSDIDGKSPPGYGEIEKLRLEAASLPVELCTRLAEATELSDAALIDKVISDIRVHNVQLFSGLAGLAENFAYDEILALVEKRKITRR